MFLFSLPSTFSTITAVFLSFCLRGFSYDSSSDVLSQLLSTHSTTGICGCCVPWSEAVSSVSSHTEEPSVLPRKLPSSKLISMSKVVQEIPVHFIE